METCKPDVIAPAYAHNGYMTTDINSLRNNLQHGVQHAVAVVKVLEVLQKFARRNMPSPQACSTAKSLHCLSFDADQVCGVHVHVVL
jgi:hypothetical protein